MKHDNEHIREDTIRLRDELTTRAFDDTGKVKNSDLAEVVWKINSCLYNGYPRRAKNLDNVTA